MLYTATLTIMSTSEVIIEVYIMPEDASPGALFSFQFKDPFLVFQGWRGSLQTLSFCVSSRPGYTGSSVFSPSGSRRELVGG